MAASDAKPVPVKNAAYRITFPIYDADGDLVTGATGLDSEVSKDGGTFADCTNEATEIATSSGMYYLDLTSTEMNADTVAVIVKTSSSGAKTTVVVLNPQEAGDIKVDVETISDDATAASNAEAFFDGTGYAGTGNVIPTVTTLTNAPSDSSGTTTLLSRVTSTRAGYLDNLSGGAVALASGVNVTQISGDSVAADNLEAALDGTGGVTITAGLTGNVTGNLSGSVGSVTSGVTVSTNNDKSGYVLSSGGLANISAWTVAIAGNITGNLSGSVGSVTGNVGGNVSGSVGSISGVTFPSNFGALVITAGGVVDADLETIKGQTVTCAAGVTIGVYVGGTAAAATATALSSLDTKIGTPSSLSGTPATIADNLAEIHSDGQTTAGIVTAQGSTSLATILADTNELQTDWANGGRLDLILDAIAANVVLVLADTGTDGVVLSAATCNKIADHVRRRTQANVEASSDGDTLSLLSEYGFIQMAQESAASGTTLTVKRTDGTTTLGTRTLAADAAADPVTGVS